MERMSRVWAQMAQVDYPAILAEAWQQHLAPRADNAPTVISIFAGAGGSSLGYSMAGFRELLAVEWDNNAVETFKLNFPGIPVYHGDIAKLSVERCMELAGLTEPGQLDVLDGSPPCQGFSTAGKRVLNDPRNQLFQEYVRLLRGLQPRVFVMENVSGMVKGKMKLVFADILRALKASGYKVSARLLNAMYFNVPQSRQRLIFIGVREDLGIAPSHPKAESRPITSGHACRDITDVSLGKPTLAVRKVSGLIRPGENAGKYTETGTAFSVSRLDAKKPSPTITKNLAGMSGILQFRGFGYLSEGQLKRLGSFPDDFVLIGSSQARWERIGNSVPPLFMRSIALHIKREILAI